MMNQVRRIQGRAIRRCGQLLKEIEKGSGKNHGEKGTAPALSVTRQDAAQDAGLSERQAKNAIRLANVEADTFESQVESNPKHS